MKKTPSISKKNARLNTKKNPHELESPANYKRHYVSWQFTYIDQESDWGIEHLRPKYKLELSNQSEDQLSEIIDDKDELFDYLIKKINEAKSKEFRKRRDVIEFVLKDTPTDIPYQLISLVYDSIEENTFRTDFLNRIKHFETQTWAFIEHDDRKSHHSIDVVDLTKAAKKRLEKLKLNDVEQVFSIRFNSLFRVIGIRSFGYLRVLWIDPGHEVCKSTKKNT